MISNITYIPEKAFSIQNKFCGEHIFDPKFLPVSSSVFHIYEGLDLKASFSLELRIDPLPPNTYRKDNYLGLYLKSHTRKPVRCSFKFYKLDLEFKPIGPKYIHNFNYLQEEGYPYFLNLNDNKNKFNEWTVKVEGVLYGDALNEIIYNQIGEISRQERSTIAKEVSLLYSSSNIKGLEKDISISFSTCDETLHAHSSILMLRSPVFRAMLSDRCQESITKEIKIEDIGFDCFKQILNFIYTDECELHANTFDLLNGSIKYGIESLAMKIEDYLLDSINNENAALCLYYSDLYRVESLKKNVLGYISRNRECINTEGFFETINNVQLLTEILTVIAKCSKNITSVDVAK